MKLISIVIPIYNEESTIVELWNRLYNTIQIIPYKFVINFINYICIFEHCVHQPHALIPVEVQYL